jgi:hypothetical protein
MQIIFYKIKIFLKGLNIFFIKNLGTVCEIYLAFPQQLNYYLHYFFPNAINNLL